MSYQALICTVTQVSPIPGADRIQLALVAGHQVIVSREVKPGDLGCFFPSDGAISHEMAFHNNLYRQGKGENKDPKASGFFEENRRVKTIKMKQCMSDGFWCPVASLAWTGAVLTDGQAFTHLNDKLVCEKYYSRDTQQLINSAKKKQGKQAQAPRINTGALLEHYDTPQLKYLIGNFQEGAVVWITEKLHGTSGRTGNVKCRIAVTPFQYWYNRVVGWFGLPQYNPDRYVVCSGTRHVNLNPEPTDPQDRGYYAGSTFRAQIHQWIQAKRLAQGETLFYEIVGFEERGTTIMPAHKADPKEHKQFFSLYPSLLHRYAYGCDPSSPNDFGGKFKVFVYRISIQDELMNTHDLTWAQTRKRCAELGLEPVPTLAGPFVIGEQFSKEALMELATKLADGPSTLDSSHTREGVVVIGESTAVQRGFKLKGWMFKSMEGILKDDEKYVDPEEVS